MTHAQLTAIYDRLITEANDLRQKANAITGTDAPSHNTFLMYMGSALTLTGIAAGYLAAITITPLDEERLYEGK